LNRAASTGTRPIQLRKRPGPLEPFCLEPEIWEIFPLAAGGFAGQIRLTGSEGLDKVWLGAILEPKELIEAGSVAQRSLRRASDDEGVSDDVDDGDSSDQMLPVAKAAKVWTQVGYTVVQSSSKRWRGQGWTDNSW
jgi:hypothetical protein